MDDENIDSFFEESEIFKEDRLNEKDQLGRPSINPINSSLRCKRCNGNNIDMRHLQIRRSDEAPTLVYYCVNCNKVI